MHSKISWINLNRLLVLAIFKATDARHVDAAREWDDEAVYPEGARSIMSAFLFLGAFTAEGMVIAGLILASIFLDGHVALYFLYFLPTLPLICGLSGEV